jgi:hypothetical protein
MGFCPARIDWPADPYSVLSRLEEALVLPLKSSGR